jgi:hypothetical protein
MPSLLDPKFRYTRAAETNVRETFRRERKRLAEKLRAEADRKDDKVLKMNAVQRKAA